MHDGITPRHIFPIRHWTSNRSMSHGILRRAVSLSASAHNLKWCRRQCHRATTTATTTAEWHSCWPINAPLGKTIWGAQVWLNSHGFAYGGRKMPTMGRRTSARRARAVRAIDNANLCDCSSNCAHIKDHKCLCAAAAATAWSYFI